MEHHSIVKKPKILCLHGHGSSGAILEKQISQWPESVLGELDLVFINAPFPLQDNKGNYDPLHFEWFQANENFTKYKNFDECIEYIEDCMVKLGPFDGVLGFSQGALISAALPGMQAQGVALTKVDKIKFVVVISGGKFGGSRFSTPKLAENAFSSPIQCPSLHITGETDFAKPDAIELLASFVDPFVILHHEGHVIPKLDEEGLKVMFQFIEKIQSLLHKHFKKIQSNMWRDGGRFF
ncbi:hypothetical protein LguiA_005344 [Lonicera macranthoides]